MKSTPKHARIFSPIGRALDRIMQYEAATGKRVRRG